MEFQDNLKQARKNANLSRKDIASILNMNPNAYGMYETGKREPNLENLLKIASALNVSVDTLLGYSPSDFDKYKQFIISASDRGIKYSVIEDENGKIELEYIEYMDGGEITSGIEFSSKGDFCSFVQEIMDNYSKATVKAKGYFVWEAVTLRQAKNEFDIIPDE